MGEYETAYIGYIWVLLGLVLMRVCLVKQDYMGSEKNQMKLRIGDYVRVLDMKTYRMFRDVQRRAGYSLASLGDQMLPGEVILFWNGECLLPSVFRSKHEFEMGEFLRRLDRSYNSVGVSVLEEGDYVKIMYPMEFYIIRDIVKKYGYAFPSNYKEFQCRMQSSYIVWENDCVRSGRKMKGSQLPLNFSKFISLLENSLLMNRVKKWRTELTDDQRLNYALISGLPQELTSIDLNDFSDETIIAIYTTLRNERNIAAW